jgi:hypothetical protein
MSAECQIEFACSHHSKGSGIPEMGKNLIITNLDGYPQMYVGQVQPCQGWLDCVLGTQGALTLFSTLGFRS